MERPLVAIGCAVAAVAFAAPARAASFDCAKAATPIEKKVCADPGLSAQDSELAAAYRAALAVTPTPMTLRFQQRQWLHDLGVGEVILKTAYDIRIRELKAQAAGAAAIRKPVPAASVASRCIPVQDEMTCTVIEAGKVQVVPGAPWLWQHQGLKGDEEGVKGESLVLLQPSADGRTATPVVWRTDDAAYFGEPGLNRTPFGAVLEIPGHLDGTGNFNDGSAFLVRDGRLVELDAQSWTEALARRLPKGLEVWKGVYIDYKTMTAASPLWRPGDGNCCATGGRVDLTFRITGDAVVIDKLKVTRGAKAAASF